MRRTLASRHIAVFPQVVRSGWSGMTAGRLLRPAPTVSPAASNDAVLRMFQDQPELHAVAVVHDDGRKSVEGSFTPDEVAGLAARAGLTGARVEAHFPCRLVLTWQAPAGAGAPA